MVEAAIGMLAISTNLLLSAFVLTAVASPTASVVVGMISFLAIIAFLRWLADRFDKIWFGNRSDTEGPALLRAISTTAAKWMLACFSAIYVFSAIVVLLFLPEREIQLAQPILTFILAAVWLAYVLFVITKMVSSTSVSPSELAALARNSVIGALVLSVYFLIPFDWVVTQFYGAFCGADCVDSPFVYAEPRNSGVLWLQSSAIPTIISIGFGILTSYVTSLVWYSYYDKLWGQGLLSLSSSRDGRDPANDELWFGRLQGSRERVILSGMTLGGWFRNWSSLRQALAAALVRDTLHHIVFIIPGPENAAFWYRLRDEVDADKSMVADLVTRLSVALEAIFMLLPDDDAAETDEGAKKVRSVLEERRTQFEKNIANSELASVVAQKLIQAPKELALGGAGKVAFVLAEGTIIGASLIDKGIYYTTYLPGRPDKDCPQMDVDTSSKLGRSLHAALISSAAKGRFLTSKSDVVAEMIRLKDECTKRQWKPGAQSPHWLWE